MAAEFTQAELEAYLDEALGAERMAEIEHVLRQRPELLRRLAAIHSRRDVGVHTLAEIWRRSQIGVPTREELSDYLSGRLPKEHAAYIKFRVDTLKCRFTIANLRDLQAQQREAEAQTMARRNKYFRSSVGHLKE
jgi:anti-sigma factor RsiW